SMRLGISSYTYVWAVGVPGFEQPQQPLTAKALLKKASDLGVSVVQIADNLPLHRFSNSDLDDLAALAQEKRIDLEVGTCGIEPGHLRTYLDIAVRLRSSLIRVLIDTDTSFPTSGEAVAAIQ